MLVIVGLLLAIVVVIRGLLGDIDWHQVRDSIAQLHPWQFALLIMALLVRQFLNALPLSLYIEGCSPWRAMQNDQAAIMMTTVAPPPSDIVLRLLMFSSWGISATAGLAGTVMNTVTFYVVRFGAPLLGVLVMLVLGTFHVGEFVPAVLSGAVSVSLLTVLWLAFRDEAFAIRLTGRLARIAGGVGRTVDPQAWVDWAVEFRGRVADRMPWALPRSLVTLIAMITVDAAMIVMSLRFAGVSATEVPAVEVVVAFLVAYPLTLFPFSGLGILDAVVVATLLAIEAGADEATLVAGFVVWRAVTIIGPLVLGALSVAAWKIEVIRSS